MSSDDSEPEITLNTDLLPAKSKERYIAAYESFIAWRKEENITSMDEDVLLAYFRNLATKYKPTTLWCMYSMVKFSLKSYHDINMENYHRVTGLLKMLSKGYVCRKAKVLSMEHVEKFIDEAPDDKYLATKVVLIFGVAGALGRQELCEITTHDIENHGEVFLVKVPNAKNKSRGSFVIQGKHYNIVKKYVRLRTDKAHSDRFFQQFRDGKCRAQNIGINRIGMMPKEIAEFLKLPDAKMYTGHSFRNISRTPVDATAWLTERWAESIHDSDSSTRTSGVELIQVQLEPEVPQESQEPSGEQCRFCGEWKACAAVDSKSYLMGNKTSLALNHLRVELDFSIDSLPRTVCQDCDAKLQETFDFIKLVNTAQFSLVAVSPKINVTIANNVARTYTHTSKNYQHFNTEIVKAEFESDESEETTNIEDALAVSETIYLRDSHKRKKDKDVRKHKKAKKEEEIQSAEVIIDIKEEILDSDESDFDDTGTEVKPSELEHDGSADIYQSDSQTSDWQVKGNSNNSGQCND